MYCSSVNLREQRIYFRSGTREQPNLNDHFMDMYKAGASGGWYGQATGADSFVLQLPELNLGTGYSDTLLAANVC